MPRNSKVIGIEQSLGLASERGISRRGYKDAPPMQELLREVKEISLRYISQAPADIRESRALQKEAEDLFARIGEKLWPAGDVPRPSWLADPSKDTLGGKYKRDLRFSSPADRPELRKHFIQLVVEKTCILHDNEQAKVRKLRQGLLDPINASGDDEAASDGDLTMQDTPGPPTGASTTRSSLARPLSATKSDDIAGEPRPGFHAVNHVPATRKSVNHGGNAKDTGMPADLDNAPDTRPTIQQEERTAHDTPTKEAIPRVTRKRANTVEQAAASKKSCVAADENVDTINDALPLRPAVESQSDSSHALPTPASHKKAQIPRRTQPRPKREATRAAPQIKSSAKRSRPNRPSQTRPVESSDLMRSILGDLADCRSVSELIRVSPDIKYNRHMLETIKNTIDQNPESKDNLSYFHDTLQEVTGQQADQFTPSNPDAASNQPTGPSASTSGRPLAIVEMNWGRDLDFIDAFELPLVQSLHEFFRLVNNHMPRDLRNSGRRLREINVTPVTDVIGRKINFRIPSDPALGRAPLRLLMHRLKSHVPSVDDEIEVELMFTAVWDE